MHEANGSFEYRCGVMSRVAKLLEEIKQLPKEDRALLRAELDELDDGESSDLDPAFRAELEARLRSIENGSAVLLDGDAVMAELRAKYTVLVRSPSTAGS